MTRGPTRRQSQSGFTLVELLVVVGIIALLVAFLVPALRRARTQAGLIQCLSGARQVFLAVQMYNNDYRQFYPHGHNVHEGTPAGAPQPQLWHVQLVKLGYLKREMQSNRGGCPAGPPLPETLPPGFPANYWETYGSDHYTHPHHFDLDSDYPYPTRVSYGLNAYIQSGWAHNGAELPGGGYYKAFGAHKQTSPPIRKHGDKIGLIFCSCIPWSFDSDEIYPGIYSAAGVNLHYLRYPDATLMKIEGRHHGAGIPVVYCDGHGENYRVEDLGIPWIPTPSQPLMWWSRYYLVFWRIAGGSF